MNSNVTLCTEFLVRHVHRATLMKLKDQFCNPEKRTHSKCKNFSLADKGANVAKHAWSAGHEIDSKNAQIIDKEIKRKGKIFEWWHTASD